MLKVLAVSFEKLSRAQIIGLVSKSLHVMEGSPWHCQFIVHPEFRFPEIS